MSAYALAHGLHVMAAITTLALFLLRGGWMVMGSVMLQRRWVRVLPHIVDTVLLLSALYLAAAFYQYPMVHHPWITAKLLGLVAYIVLGTIALKRGRTQGVRLAAFIGALVVFAYLVETAVTKTPTPF